MYSQLEPIDKWWSSITTSQKEHIARKLIINSKKEQGEDSPIALPHEYQYPACTTIWLSLSPTLKEQIRSHCEQGHGFLELEEQQGWMFSE